MSTRISVPRPPHAHVPRPHLVQRLDACRGAAVRVVQAPAGYGKTQLVAEWARAQPLDEAVVWVTVERRSGTPAGFWRTLAERLGRLSPGGDAAHPQDADEAQEAALRLAAALDRPLTVVVDRFEALTDDTVAENLFRWAAATEDVSVVLAARTRPPAALMSGVGAAVVLGASDLAFTAEETADLAAGLGAPLAESAAETLAREAEGWPLAIRIALQHSADGDAGPWQESGDTVAEAQRELLGGLVGHPGFPALATASVAEAVTPELADALGIRADHLPVFDETVQRGLGWWEHRDGERFFRIHPVIRRALRDRLAPADRREAYAALASWLSARGEHGPAFGAAIESERWDLARHLAYAAFADITAYMSFSTDAVAKLPPAVTRSDAMLGFLSALSAYARGHTARAISALGSAFATSQRRRLLAPGRVTPERVWAQGLLAAGLRLSGRYEFVGPALERFQTMLREVEDPEGLLAPAMGLFANEVAVTELYLDRLEEARQALTHAPRAAGRTKKQQFYGDAMDALILVQQGRFEDAGRRVRALREEGLPPGFEDSFYGIPLQLAAAALHLEDGAPADAAAALRRTEPHWSTTENWPLLLVAHTEASWHGGDALTALETFDVRQAEQHRRARVSPALTARLRAIKAELLVAAGRPREARQLLGGHLRHPRLAVARAMTLLVEGRLADAAATTEEALRLPGLTARDRVDLQLIAAACALRAGDVPAAARPFRTAADLAVRNGMSTPFARLGLDERRRLLDEVGAGREWRDALLARPALFPEGSGEAPLTKKELVALQDLARGVTLARAAERHRVSVNTIKAQRRTLYRKLGVSTATEAVRRARERGLL
jgi:ATP/maltotriose-dependent transcriptional regulator MalT